MGGASGRGSLAAADRRRDCAGHEPDRALQSACSLSRHPRTRGVAASLTALAAQYSSHRDLCRGWLCRVERASRSAQAASVVRGAAQTLHVARVANPAPAGSADRVVCGEPRSLATRLPSNANGGLDLFSKRPRVRPSVVVRSALVTRGAASPRARVSTVRLSPATAQQVRRARRHKGPVRRRRTTTRCRKAQSSLCAGPHRLCAISSQPWHGTNGTEGIPQHRHVARRLGRRRSCARLS